MIGMDARFVGIAELAGAPPVAVVVDVMRAFTVAAWAFARGAEKIVLAGTLDEALALKARHPDWLTLKDGPPAPGFDAVNSPGMLRSVHRVHNYRSHDRCRPVPAPCRSVARCRPAGGERASRLARSPFR
jgi:hypothetical protein